MAASCGLMTGHVRQAPPQPDPSAVCPTSQDERDLLVNGDLTVNVLKVEEYMRNLYQMPGHDSLAPPHQVEESTNVLLDMQNLDNSSAFSLPGKTLAVEVCVGHTRSGIEHLYCPAERSNGSKGPG